MLVVGDHISIFWWRDFQPAAELTKMASSMFLEFQLRPLVATSQGRQYVTMTAKTGQGRAGIQLQVWNTDDLGTESATALPKAPQSCLVDNVEHIIRSLGQRLIFVDITGYVCSVDLEMEDMNENDRHFMVPGDWLSTNNNLIIELARNGDILFVRRAEVAVIKRGLDITERGQFNTFKRLSASSGSSKGKKPVWLSVPSRSY